MQYEEVDLRGFCAAPWVESVLYRNGGLRTCCNNITIFGNWQKENLKKSWHGETFQNFRKHIVNGSFPDETCKICYYNSRAHLLHGMLIRPFKRNMKTVFGFLNKEIPEISNIESQFDLKRANASTEIILEQYFSAIGGLEAKTSSFPPEINLALNKLTVIGRITKAFLEGDLTPPVVAPYRQPQLISKCNARCIQCPGLYIKDIIRGPSMDEKYIEQAFSHTEDIIDFIMMGSEFLLYKGWKKIANYLVANGVKLSISTNGILLTPATIRYLIDNKIVHYLNVSLDGATKETVESIRVNVNFNKLIENIKFLFQYASEKQYRFALSFSFVFMKRNYKELPELIRLIDHIRNGKNGVEIQIIGQALTDFESDEYRSFVHKEHHALIDKGDLTAIIEQALKESKNTAILVSVFGSYDLEDFLQRGCPAPPLLIPRPKAVTKSKETELSTTSQTLKPQVPLEPRDNVVAVNANAKVKIAPVLRVPLEDQGKNVQIYAAIVIDNDVYIAIQDGPFGNVNWTHRPGPLEEIADRNEIPPFARVTLRELLPFNLGLNNINLKEFTGIADIYYGYSTSTILPLSSFVGAAYRLIAENC